MTDQADPMTNKVIYIKDYLLAHPEFEENYRKHTETKPRPHDYRRNFHLIKDALSGKPEGITPKWPKKY